MAVLGALLLASCSQEPGTTVPSTATTTATTTVTTIDNTTTATQPATTGPAPTPPKPPRPITATVASDNPRTTAVRPTPISVTLPVRSGPVVDLFYAIHVHTRSEWAPFTDPDLTDLDTAEAQGFVDQIEAIAGVLDAHRARGSFHFTYGTAAGLCRHDPGLFDDLEADGHEIGLHAHTNPFLLRASDEMRRTCGREIRTGSGLAAMAGGPEDATRASLGASLRVFVDVGATQLLVNMADECGMTTSGGNDLTPWRADPADICAPSPGGIVMIDQAPLEYVVVGAHPADVFSEAEFSTLAALGEAAVSEAGSLPTDAVAAWGFVTHTNEYVVGASALARPEPAALDGLDLLLARLDPYVEAGLARWSTAAEIAARVD
jgi:hypothetical protein